MEVFRYSVSNYSNYLMPMLLNSKTFACCVISSAATLASCASTKPVAVNTPQPVQDVVKEVEEEKPVEVESPAGPVGGIAFPELQGTWVSSCRPMFDDEPEEGFEITQISVSGNEFVSNTTVYSDSSCSSELSRGFMQAGSTFQFYAQISRPGGSANTVVGLAPNIDIDMQRATIDNKPLSAAIAPFMPLEVDYNIVFVESGSAMYLGEGGESTGDRSRELNLDKRYVKR